MSKLNAVLYTFLMLAAIFVVGFGVVAIVAFATQVVAIVLIIICVSALAVGIYKSLR